MTRLVKGDPSLAGKISRILHCKKVFLVPDHKYLIVQVYHHNEKQMQTKTSYRASKGIYFIKNVEAEILRMF